jgi:hypothetical protein
MPWSNCGSNGLPPIRMPSKGFREFIGLLNSHGVEYLAVGVAVLSRCTEGHAVRAIWIFGYGAGRLRSL